MERTLDVQGPVSSQPPTFDIADPSNATRVLRLLDRIAPVVNLLRPRQWVKAAAVLASPLVTAPVAAVSHSAPLALTVLSFLAASSTVYVFNDLRDRERDRLHPTKRLRPIASGQVQPPLAVAVLVVLALATLALLTALPWRVGLVVGAYLAVNLWYCLALKHQPVVDVSIVAAGFVLRVLAGTLAVGLASQPSLLICVYCACLALSLGKRRHELARLSNDDGTAARHRPALSAYSVPFLDHVVVVNLVGALVGYTAFIWLQSPPYGPLTAALTFPFAAFTVYRYLQLIMLHQSGGDPVVDLARDRTMVINFGLWAAVLLANLAAGTW